jgi:hypothetical protein
MRWCSSDGVWLVWSVRRALLEVRMGWKVSEVLDMSSSRGGKLLLMKTRWCQRRSERRKTPQTLLVTFELGSKQAWPKYSYSYSVKHDQK